MPTKEEMRTLTDEIVRSYEDRISGIGELRQTVKTDLKEFQDSRTAMGKELRADLAKSVADRRAAVSTQLEELDAAHAAMSRELRDDLAKVRPALEDEDRKRQSETREFMGELGKAVAQGKIAVKTQLKEFDDAHAAMSRELRDDLAKVRPALEEEDRKRQGEARQFRGELTSVVAEGKAAARARLKEFADIQGGARDEWQKLTNTMQAKRGTLVVEVRPPEAVAPPPVEEVAPPPPVEEIAEEEAVAHAEVAEVTPEIAVLRDQVFEYLANHPDGTRLVELEEEFGLARIQMARVVRNLTDENKVEKRGLLYFAI